MPFSLDPNAVYPISVILIVVIGIIVNFKICATPSDITLLKKEMAELEGRMAREYVLKEDFNKKLDDFKADMNRALGTIERQLERIFDKIESMGHNP